LTIISSSAKDIYRELQQDLKKRNIEPKEMNGDFIDCKSEFFKQGKSKKNSVFYIIALTCLKNNKSILKRCHHVV